MEPLQVFTNDCDTVIAASIDDAGAVLREYGYTDVDPESLDEVDPATEITIHCDSYGTPAMPGDPGVQPITRTAAQWITRRGRGFLCTTEY